MELPQEISVFEAKPNRWLLREGVRGPARVRLNPDGVGIIGSEGGAIEVVPTRVTSLRVGTERLFQRGNSYEMRLRIAGRSGSLVLRPVEGHVAGFGGVCIGLARAIEKGGHRARLELGESLGRVLFIAAVLCLPLVLVLTLYLLGAFQPNSGIGAAILIVPLLLALAGIAVAWRGRPRLAASFAEFETTVRTWVARAA